MDSNIKNQVKNIMSAVLEIPIDQIDDAASPDTIESWDSLKHMNLIVALEEEFKLQFDDEQTLEMLNYELICNIVNEMLNRQ